MTGEGVALLGGKESASARSLPRPDASTQTDWAAASAS